MRKYFASVLIVSLFIGLAFASAPITKAKDKKPDIPEKELEKIVFIHYKKPAKHPCNNDGVCDADEKPSCADCKNGSGSKKESSCYKFIGRNVKWRWTEDFVVSTSLSPNQSTIDTSANTWDEQVPFDIFADISRVGDYPWGVYDYNNSISFGDYPEENVIAVTAIWWSPPLKAIVEYDIMFDTDFAWGDAIIDATLMDLQNIATHEFGHGAGMDDLYDGACIDETMYGYSNYGETKKRDLHTGDITGIKELYSRK